MKRLTYIEYAIGIAAWLLGIYFYMHFPDRVAIHWNFAGEVNGYAGKGFGSFFVPALITFFIALFHIIPHFDPESSRYAHSRQFATMKYSLLLFMLVIFIVTSSVSLGAHIRIDRYIAAAVGILLGVIGFSLQGIERNGFFGIRTPWTMRSENVWKKTHEIGVWAFLFFGACIVIAPWLPIAWAIVLFVLGVLLVTVGLSVYSFILYRREHLKN